MQRYIVAWESSPVLFFPLKTGKWILKLVYFPSLSSPSLSGTRISLFSSTGESKTCSKWPQQDTTGPPAHLPLSLSASTWFRLLEATCSPLRRVGFLRDPSMPSPGLPSSMGEGSQFRSKYHPSQEDLSLSSILTSSTSCPSKAFPICSQHSQDWAD